MIEIIIIIGIIGNILGGGFIRLGGGRGKRRL